MALLACADFPGIGSRHLQEESGEDTGTNDGAGGDLDVGGSASVAGGHRLAGVDSAGARWHGAGSRACRGANWASWASGVRGSAGASGTWGSGAVVGGCGLGLRAVRDGDGGWAHVAWAAGGGSLDLA